MQQKPSTPSTRPSTRTPTTPPSSSLTCVFHCSSSSDDEELAAERQAGEIEVWLSGKVYDALRQANRYRPALAEILIAFEEHGLMGLLREARSILGRALTLGDRRGTPVVSFTVASGRLHDTGKESR